MTPDEEDDLVSEAVARILNFDGAAWTDSIRLAIRAAVAHERERAARSVEVMDTNGSDKYIETTSDLCDALASAIRRGEAVKSMNAEKP